ncbi:hypothetical protein G7Y89_g11569 [Cudoniella acicularis]|uniref:Uncharacterized protein n=1 Tax=Cudoniella acicularis TaxID=354080 RepID=A0A8H4RDG7_9HELO|nr:hypothetical protein G7Y89_g11569 [Cudoniella acicularis]
MVRGGLVGGIFEKILKLPYDKSTEAKAMTLMISDVQRISSALIHIHELWAGPLETALAIWLLWRQVGPSSLSVLGIALGKFKFMSSDFIQLMRDSIINETKNVLASLKAIKMTGANERVTASIESLRKDEFDASKLFRTLIVAYGTLTLSPVLVFGVYAAVVQGKRKNFDASRLFTSLILISLLASPLIKFLQIIPSFGAARGCFSRLEEYMYKPERKDRRLNNSNQEFRAVEDNAGESVSWNKGTASEKVDDLAESVDRLAISFRNADLGWGNKSQLKNIDLEIRKGEHVTISGTVGSGKTLLLQAILGELEPLSGEVSLENTTIGYCAQSSWLENLTVQENIFRGLPMDEIWRRKIIHTCALNDLIGSQNTEQTIGSGGAKLSNGERQRLALARTIAFRPSIVLLDNVFSSIDRKTEKHIVENLFGSDGILRQMGTTIVEIIQDRSSNNIADRFLNIDESGQLKACEPSDSGLSAREDNIEPTQGSLSESPETTSDKVVKGPIISKETDTTRVTDMTVYQAYFSAIGRANMVIFFVWGAAFAFTLKFPGKYTLWKIQCNSNVIPRCVGAVVVQHKYGTFSQEHRLLDWNICNVASSTTAHAFRMARIVPTSGVGLHRRLLRTTLDATFVFINRIDSGSLINRFNQDLMLVDFRLPLEFFNTAAEGFTCVVQVVLVAVAAVYALITLPAIFTGAAVGLRDKTTAGAIGVAFLNMTTLGETMTNVITSWTSMETSLAAIARIESFDRETPVEAEVKSPVEVSPEWPAAGNLQVKNLWASYDTKAHESDWSIRNISLDIQAGEKIAICGRSGAGKSTFLMTLLALIDGQRGDIIIDDVDISHVGRSLLRSRFYVISQDTFLQENTVRDALQTRGNHSDEAMTDALAECALLVKITESGGLSANMSDTNLSAGESQLFALARTILEAGSRPGKLTTYYSIDIATEKKIMRLIAERLQGKTIISVLHRLEVALEYDRILILEKGEVVHFGSAEEVLQQSELFSELR